MVLAFLICSLWLPAQYEYEPSVTHPYGLPNPEAPMEIKDFQPMIGICDCKSSTSNQDGSWAAPFDMTWEFKYIMNGMAVQDQTLKADGKHSGSIRQYNPEQGTWYVHYYSSASAPPNLATWQGGKNGSDIILYQDQKAPNGMEGKYKITFHDITDTGFNWLGEWVNPDETFTFPTWKITCNKR